MHNQWRTDTRLNMWTDTSNTETALKKTSVTKDESFSSSPSCHSWIAFANECKENANISLWVLTLQAWTCKWCTEPILLQRVGLSTPPLPVSAPTFNLRLFWCFRGRASTELGRDWHYTRVQFSLDASLALLRLRCLEVTRQKKKIKNRERASADLVTDHSGWKSSSSFSFFFLFVVISLRPQRRGFKPSSLQE